MKYLISPAILAVTAACTAAPPAYSPPEDSGLIALRTYPGPADVCVALGENENTNQYLDHTQFLIGCPTSERGAILDRQQEGAKVVGQVGAWTLLSFPIN